MLELANDIAICCDHCHEIIYRQRELYDSQETYQDHGENGMGIETFASIEDDLDCPNCGNRITFELLASEYADDVVNVVPRIHGGSFLENPEMELLREDEEQDFFEWAYDRADDVQRLIIDLAGDRNLMYQLQPRDFEIVVERIYRDKGFRTELTQPTRDGGKDIIAWKNIGTRIPIKIYIECKRFAPDRPVGEPIIRGLYGVMTDASINRAMLVTSSYISRDAFNFVRRQGALIELINGDDLQRLICRNVDKYFDSVR